MSKLHIYKPKAWEGRTIHYCTTCRKRRRFIVRMFEYYPSWWQCGGCGYTFVSGEGRMAEGKKSRERTRSWVKRSWKNCHKLDIASAELTEYVVQQSLTNSTKHNQ